MRNSCIAQGFFLTIKRFGVFSATNLKISLATCVRNYFIGVFLEVGEKILLEIGKD